ncbi:MAG: hypothetical protein HY777_15510 [Betaproteobacteria bacterium]|nr:hypothetical protein [Betaproteobacteria bacterium]
MGISHPNRPRDCVCVSVDHEALRHALEEGEGVSYAELLATRPHLFSDTMVFVGAAQLQRMADLIATIEQVVALPAYRERVFAHAPEIARHASPAAGVFLGYDFHLGADGPQLIEINTNAGGGLLNAKLLRAQRACCGQMAATISVQPAPEAAFVAMFREEWRLARGDAPPNCIAIVDESPGGQYLAPEFELFRDLFQSHGIAAIVADPAQLSFHPVGGQLRCGSQIVDLVYNRLTDFAFDDPQHRVLRDAYLADAVVTTPHPHAHALYADKRNLVALTDENWLTGIGLGTAERALLLGGIPRTVEVRPDNAETFWSSRKQWFFKPAAGYGGKAAYRGDKLTKRVFAEISRGGYIAQALVPPSERRLLVDGVEQDLKLDLRNYVYRSAVQLVSARLYQGQTTNFRTPGGGFAAVFSVLCRGERKG